MKEIHDVIIVGAGPAGLNAALVLARCLRKVIIFDHGKPRNLKAREMHAFISRDGESPAEFLSKAKKELEKYSLEVQKKEITNACKINGLFKVEDLKGQVYFSKKLLLATGLVDDLPQIQGIDEMYGKSIHHCPYCDGYEKRNQPIAVYGKSKSGAGLALSLTTWSQDVVLCTDGKKLTIPEVEKLIDCGIKIYNQPIESLDGKDGCLEKIWFKDGSYLPRKALFFTTDQYQKSSLASILGCDFTKKGVVKTRNQQKTNVDGLYVAGDAARDMQLVIIAAGEGAKAAVSINMDLQKEEVQKKQSLAI
jgi:thioredoxin reductase